MSRHGAVDPQTGQFADIVCRKDQPGWYTVYLGKHALGQVAYDSYDGWTAISFAGASTILGWRSTRGFKSRWFAIEYLLRAGGIWASPGTYQPPAGQVYARSCCPTCSLPSVRLVAVSGPVGAASYVHRCRAGHEWSNKSSV